MFSSFSALGRAVGDETRYVRRFGQTQVRFSALGRAVGDETFPRLWRNYQQCNVSVLSVEPWGMKRVDSVDVAVLLISFSALGRAVGDETASSHSMARMENRFQCSRSSRGG